MEKVKCWPCWLWQCSPPDLEHTVTISESGTAVSGHNFSLTCTVDVSIPPVVQWIYPNSTVITNSRWITVGTLVRANTITSLTLIFEPLVTSHGGQYTCHSKVDVVSSARNSTRNVAVQSELVHTLCAHCFVFQIWINFVCVLSWLVASPYLSTTREPNGTLYVNQIVTLTCTATLPQHVDTSVTVVVTWTGPRVWSTITMATQETYINTVTVNTLQTTDSGSYTCSAIARPDVSSTFVTASTNTTSVLNIVVVGKTQLTQSQAE